MRSRQLILPLAVLALVCVTAIQRQATLRGLREQARGLEESLAHATTTAAFASPSAVATPMLSAEQRAALFPEAKAAFFDIVNSPGVSPEQYERFSHACLELDVPSLLSLMAALKADPALPPNQLEDFELHFANQVADQQPEKALAILLSLPTVDGSRLCYPLGQWSAIDPAAAATWFEQQLRAGNPATNDPDLRRQALEALFRADPDRGLQLALRLLHEDPNATTEIKKLAAQTVTSLADEREHASYLAALRRVADKSPGDPVLAQIRAAYLDELPEQLKVWAFDDVTTLLSNELSTAEKLATALKLSTATELDTPELWADWFAKIGGESDKQYPLCNYLCTWSLIDCLAVGQWLDRYRDGAIPSELVLEYASRIRDPFPEEAARHAMALPSSPQREEVLNAIHSSWQAKDPEAAARFAHENGLEP